MSGRILAVDLGEKRIGIALSDPGRRLARGHTVLKRRSRKEDFSRIASIAAEFDVSLVVFGLPLQADGSDSQMTAWARNYGAALAEALPIPLTFADESLTTQQAQHALKLRGVKGRKQNKRIDAVAAAFILQGYLDAQRETPKHRFDRPAGDDT